MPYRESAAPKKPSWLSRWWAAYRESVLGLLGTTLWVVPVCLGVMGVIWGFLWLIQSSNAADARTRAAQEKVLQRQCAQACPAFVHGTPLPTLSDDAKCICAAAQSVYAIDRGTLAVKKIH